MSQHFVNHHVHSHWSLKDSTNKPHGMTKRIAELGQKGFFLTDHGVLTGFSEIQRAAKKNGVVAIPGVEFYVAIRGIDDKTARDTAHLTVWAYNIEGYRNLCRLHTISFQQGYYYDPRVDLDLLEQHSEGLMASSGCLGGMAPKALMAGDKKEAERRVKELSQIFDGRFWIEVQNHGIPEEMECLVDLTSFARKYKLPIVASTDAHYTEKDDWIPHDAFVCLRTGDKVGGENRKVEYVPEQFALKSEDEMLEKHKAAYVYESGRIFDMCEDIDISSKTFHLPQFCEAPEDKLRELTKAGLKQRYNLTRPTKESAPIFDRAEYELKTICEAGFANYLLIVRDLYNFARKENIPAGAGRGSAAGSVVCYAIGITNIDPLEHDLMFERFIDPNRVSQPDIDCDFSAEHRPRIIEYIKDKWGHDKVAQIVAFQTLGGRAAPRDVARVLGKPIPLGDKIAKLIPQEGSVTRDREERHYVADALETVKEFAALYESDEDAKEVIDLAIQLEGTLKTSSIHAAGIVVADKWLGEYCPMITVADKDDKGRLLATGYEMNELENIGLIKLDVLGIKYLDTLNRTFELARKDGVIDEDFTPNDIDVHDPSIYELLSAGRTAGVFQVEGGGMTKLLRDLKPDCYGDIATCISIFRPGPISQIPNLVHRKAGTEKIVYPHPSLKSILKETYGLTIYQEQIIKIAQVIAGYTITRADQLRSVIGKKKVEKMPQEKAEFIKSAVKQGHKESWAEGLFTDLIEPAARYAFNKSHAYSYADLTAKTAWAKANLTKYFYASLLTTAEEHADRDNKLAAYIADAREMGVAILPPDINTSDYSFTPLAKEKAVRFGLNGIKFVSGKGVAEIIKERKRGPFVDLFSTVERIKSTLVNSRCIESLVASGAMDSLPGSRASKYASLGAAMERADGLKVDRKRVAAGGKPVKRKKALPEPVLKDADEDKIAMLSQERELLGYYLSSHPWLDVASSVTAECTVQSAREELDGTELNVGGIVSRLTEHTTKKSKAKMYFGAIEDDKAVLEFVVFPRQYDQVSSVLALDKPVILYGKIENDVSEDSEGSSQAKLIVSKAERVGLGLKKKRLKEATITLVATNYRKQLADLAEEFKNADGVMEATIYLPDSSVVKILK